MNTFFQKEQMDDEYQTIHKWILLVQLNRKKEANEGLSRYVGDATSVRYLRDWISTIGAFFLGRMNETTFLANGKVSDPLDAGKEWKSWYYASIKRRLGGDEATADEYLRKRADIRRAEVTNLLPHIEMENFTKSTGGI